VTKRPSLAETHPELASEAFGWNPFTKNRNSKAQLQWKCLKGHRYTESIHNRIAAGIGCSSCKSKKKLTIEQEIKKIEKETAQIYREIKQIEKGTPAINELAKTSRKEKGLGLKRKTEITTTVYFNSANAFFEAHGWHPLDVNHKSNDWKLWKCPSGHVYSFPVATRLQYRKSQCPICNDSFKKKNIAEGFHWSQLLPLLVDQIDDWDPLSVDFDSPTIKAWRCDRKHHFKSTIAEASKQQGRCFKCKKWKPRDINLGELADQLSIDRAELVNLVQQQINGQLHAGSKLPSSVGDEVIDVLYDDKGKAICKPSVHTYDWGNHNTAGDSIRSILEHCSSCEMLIDPQREHKCRDY
jgi:hypothetical protein